MRLYRRMLSILISLVCACSLLGCRQKEDTMTVKDYPIEHELEFGGCYIKITIDDFLARGYRFGDSVHVSFSNGYVLESLPFYSGYYVGEGEPLLVGYPGYPYIKVAVYNGDDLWEDAGLSENDTATVSLNEAGRYSAMQEARDVNQSSDRSQYDSDEIFANFRPLAGGRLKENLIYRASSPCDNTYGRAAYVDALMEDSGIRLIIDLSDTEEALHEHMTENDTLSDYYVSLYNEGNVILPVMNTRYGSDEMKVKLADMLKEMCSHEGPYLIHCSLGKDRTGFVAILLEMLAGASYQEMLDDYMLTYDNFYHISPHNEPEKYRIVIDESFTSLLRYLVTDETADLTGDLSSYAEAYLKAGGMSDEDLELLKKTILDE